MFERRKEVIVTRPLTMRFEANLASKGNRPFYEISTSCIQTDETFGDESVGGECGEGERCEGR